MRKQRQHFEKMQATKEGIQEQLMEMQRKKEEAFQEYAREREMVDGIIQRMIQEDMENLQLHKQKQEQSKQDMVLSVQEKKALLRR